MKGSTKRNISSKFNKVDNNIFKNAKKLSINKSLKERKIITENFSPIKQRKGRTKSNRNLTNNFLFKKNSANFENKETNKISITNKRLKRFLSTSKINTNLILLKKKSIPINLKEKGKEKEEEKQDLNKYFNPEPENIEYKKYISSNNITHLFKSTINNKDLENKNNTFKKSKLFEKELFSSVKKNLIKNKKKDNENINEQENKSGKENKEIKDIKLKKITKEKKDNKVSKENKGKKNHKLKIINKEKNENNEDKITQEKYEKYEKKDHKFKFLCCL